MKKLRIEYKYYSVKDQIDKRLILITDREPDEDGMLKVYSFEGNPDDIIQEFSDGNLAASFMPVSPEQFRFMYIAHTTGLLNWYGWGKMVDDALYLSNAIVSEQIDANALLVSEFEDFDNDQTVQYYDEQFDPNSDLLSEETEPEVEPTIAEESDDNILGDEIPNPDK